MTIRSTVKKIDRYGIQGSVSFDPKHPNANVPLFRELEKFAKGDQGLGGAGGPLANRIQDQRSYQASHVFKTPEERDAVAARLQKQYQEQFEPKIADMAKAAGMSPDEYLSSQGITPLQYKPDDFILASQNPLRSSVEKKIKAFMSMTGNTQSISGGTGEHRRHTGYYRPNDLKHVRSMLNTEARKLREGTGNLGEMEGVYLPASQKLEARTTQNIFKNGLTEDLLNNEKHPVVGKIRSDMLKQHAMTQLKAKVKKGLQDEELLPPDEENKKKEPSAGVKALKASGIVISKILSVAGDLKSLFNVAVSYLKSIAGEIANLKQDAGTLGISTDQALKLKNLARMNPVFAPDENVYLNAAKGVLGFTSDPTKVKDINWDSVVLQKEEKLIRPILEAATSGRLKPVDTMNTIYNTLGKEYYSADPKFREGILTRQKAALEALDPSLASGYQTAIDVTKAYGLVSAAKKNTHNMMGAFSNFVEGSSSKSHIHEFLGMSAGSSYGTDEDQTNLNSFLAVLKQIEEALKKLIMVRFDDVIRLLTSLIEALLMLGSIFDGSIGNGPVDRLLEEFREGTRAQGMNQREELSNNYGLYKQALLEKLEKVEFTGSNAQSYINKAITAPDAKSVMEIFNHPGTGIEKYHGKDALRDIFILADMLRVTAKTAKYYDSLSPEDRGLVNTHKWSQESESNTFRNSVLKAAGMAGFGTKGYEKDKNLIKVRKLSEAEKQQNENQLKIDSIRLEYENEKRNLWPRLSPGERNLRKQMYQKQIETLGGAADSLTLNKYITPEMMNMPGSSNTLLATNKEPTVIRHDVNILVNGKYVIRESNNLDAAHNKIITDSIVYRG